MRRIVRLLAIAAIALVVAVGGVVLYLDSIAGAAIERGTTAATGLPTSVGGVSIRPIAGRFGVSGFAIANPSGFEAENFFAVRDLGLGLRLRELLGDEVVIDEIAIEGIDLNLEWKPSGSNWGAVMKSLEKNASASGDPEGADPAQATEWRIRSIVVRDVSASGRATVAGRTREAEASVAEIRLSDVSSRGGAGAISAQVLRRVLVAVLQGVSREGLDLGADVQAQLRGEVSRLGARLQGQATERAGAAAGEAVKGAEEAAKGLLRGVLGGEEE